MYKPLTPHRQSHIIALSIKRSTTMTEAQIRASIEAKIKNYVPSGKKATFTLPTASVGHTFVSTDVKAKLYTDSLYISSRSLKSDFAQFTCN